MFELDTGSVFKWPYRDEMAEQLFVNLIKVLDIFSQTDKKWHIKSSKTAYFIAGLSLNPHLWVSGSCIALITIIIWHEL